MLKKRRCCCTHNHFGYVRLGLFFIAVGVGLFMAYAIPRFILITFMGIVLIAAGVCFMIKK